MNVATPIPRARLERFGRTLAEFRKRRDRALYESSFLDFVEAAWPSIDPSAYAPCWALDALCEHLQAVGDGQIRRLVVNFPPRCGKTNLTSICFPAWTWARSDTSFTAGPQVRFLCGSYNHDLSLINSNMTRRLIKSPWYQQLWGNRFILLSDQNTKTKFDTSVGGTRYASSVSGSLLGIGGDIIIVDDPHNTESVESEPERATALRWWKEISTTRLNDPKQSAIIVIMQRLHEEDVSGRILQSKMSGEWVHLCIPMEYNWRRHCVTVLGWQDPRGLDEQDEPLVLVDPIGVRYPRDSEAELTLDTDRELSLMWPERFDADKVAYDKYELGPYMASGRLQQMPTPAEGGIFQSDWWQLWEPSDDKFPEFSYILASLDSSYTEKQENDPSALTVWGIFQHEGKRRIMLIHAWRKHLQFSGPRFERLAVDTIIGGQRWPAETLLPGLPTHVLNFRKASYKRRTMPKWGLMEWTEDTCNRFKIDRLLIEAKASGISAAQELGNRYGLQAWDVELCPVEGDKYARAIAAQPTFSQLMVWAPAREWSEMVIDEMAVFPKGKYRDLTDSATQAINYLRKIGLAQTDEEVSAEEVARVTHRPRPKAIYPV
jgi:predicted phage terminase large subunit-like protein